MCVSAKLYQMLLHCLCSAADLFVNISLVIFLGYSAFNLHQLESQFKVALLWDADVEASSNSTTTPGTCADWEGNNSTLGFGSDLASEAAAITSAEIKAAPITGFASGGILPSLMFDVIDHFGNLVSGTLWQQRPRACRSQNSPRTWSWNSYHHYAWGVDSGSSWGRTGAIRVFFGQRAGLRTISAVGFCDYGATKQCKGCMINQFGWH